MIPSEAPPEKSPSPPEGVRWRGAPTLLPLLLPIDTLVPDPRNARLHPDRNIAAIAASLAEFGQNKPAILHDGIVRAGNGMLLAARSLDWTHLAAMPAEHLSSEQATAYAIADNKTSDLSQWDYEELAALFKDMPQALLDATGFAAFERDPLLKANWTDEAGEAHRVRDWDLEEREKTSPVVVGATYEERTAIWTAIMMAKAHLKSKGEGDASDGRALGFICSGFVEGFGAEERRAALEAAYRRLNRDKDELEQT